MNAPNPALPAPHGAIPATRRSRLRRRRLAWTTPVQLWTLLAAVTVSALLAFGSVSVGVADAGRSFKTIGSDRATMRNALDIYFAVSDMDTDAADYLLLNGRSTASLAPVSVLGRYEQRRQAASALLISEAHNIAYGATEHRAILRMLVMVQIFDAYVGQAEVLDDRGDRAGALAAYGQATDVMHAPQSGLLETALGLANSLRANMRAVYATAQAEQGRDLALIVVSLLVLLASLAALQLFLVRRTRRVVNPPALAATVLALVLLATSASTLHATYDDLRVAKQNGYDSVYALRLLRAIAFDAKADESRYLLDSQRAAFYEASFQDKSVELASFRQRVTATTYDAALAEQLAVLQSGATPTIGGAFGQALRYVIYPGEADAARAALAAYARFESDDRTIRADARSGNLAEAIRFDTSSAPNDSGGDFKTFDSALGTWIELHERALNQAMAAGNGNLDGWQVYPALGAALIVVLTGLGVSPRLREYR